MVFTTVEERSASRVRYEMMRFYELEMLERIEKYTTKKRPAEDAAAGGVQKKTKTVGESSTSEENLEDLLAE
jgi:hypothetical protein